MYGVWWWLSNAVSHRKSPELPFGKYKEPISDFLCVFKLTNSTEDMRP